MKSYLVVGLGYGDEGKGSWVDHLVRKHGIRHVFRHNGGAQALHHVVTPEGHVHGFSQLCSGSFVPGTMTCLSRFMLVEPEALMEEAAKLQRLGVSEPLQRVLISEQAPLITPFNLLLNRIMETFRGASRHGSCGFGIGLTQGDIEQHGALAPRIGDIGTPAMLEKLEWLRAVKLEAAQQYLNDDTREMIAQLAGTDIEYYAALYSSFAARVAIVPDSALLEILQQEPVVFEGAQGVLLDQFQGFFPHCTRSTTTYENAETLLEEAGFAGEIERVGLLRAYGTRHGAGPFVSEDTSISIDPCHNVTNEWQGAFRHGWFDVVAARYALEVTGGVDTLAITNLDRLRGLPEVKVATAYRDFDPEFFTADRIIAGEYDYPTLARRTATMDSITPEYHTNPGWTQARGDAETDYLMMLSELMGHEVTAFSDTPLHGKTYCRFPARV